MSDTADIYALCDPRDGRVRYVGKANCAAKRLATHIRDSSTRDTPVYRWFRKLAGLGLLPEVKVIWTVPQAEWPEHERNAIAFFTERGVKLLNVAPGGDAPICPPEVRAENGRRCAAKRPPNIMRAYRRLEYNIRISRTHFPHRTEKLQRSCDEFKQAVALARQKGRIRELDAAMAALLDRRGMVTQAWA